MSTLAIDVHNLSKRYHIGASERPDTLRDAMTGWLRRSRPRSDRQTLWALNDVSFQVEQGDLVGIVGHNGAGKSTLLKILSRITEPTRGTASVYGRIGSLLEVGTGFHPELTGRENIYLSGAMLGMTKAEIERKFDEIVAFSGVETMIDTPIKRYSSGMNVRLGFAVAAHLEPEILLVDEVLAVGDAAFQRKCLGKMSEVAQNGRTILFVSHNLVALQSLCERAIWLNKGQVAATGDAGSVVASYLRATSSDDHQFERRWPISAEAPGNEAVRLSHVAVQTPAGDAPALLDMATPFDVVVAYWNQIAGARLHVTLHVKTEQGVVAFSTFPSAENQGVAQPAGLVRATCRVPGYLLNSGVHRVDVLLVADKSRTLFRLDNALQFEVVDSAERGDGWFGREPGVVQPRLDWTTELIEALP